MDDIKEQKLTASFNNSSKKYEIKNNKNSTIYELTEKEIRDRIEENTITIDTTDRVEENTILDHSELGGKKSRKSKRRVRKTRRLNKKHTKK